MAHLSMPVEVSVNNILVATDFSPASLLALTYILPIARQADSVVHIVHVIHPPEFDIASQAANSATCRQAHMDAQRQLERLDTVVGAISHRTWLLEGHVWETVEDLVRSQHMDLVVVGASGKSELRKFFLGSAAEAIIRKATCPVLTVGPHVSPTNAGKHLAQLLYATNLWEESHYGLRYTIQLAIRCKSQLLLLHVVEQEEPKRPDRNWLEEYRRVLQKLLPESAGDLLVEPVLRVEVARNATSRILQVADEIKGDLIVIDVRPEEAWATHLRDKVYEIISCANCPVLTIGAVSETPTSEGSA